MKQIPDIFTLLNLFFGCLAIVSIMQTGLTLSADSNGENLVVIPEKIYMASVFIGLAALVDFLDGFVARLLKASSELGKQLDSLADTVSFGGARFNCLPVSSFKFCSATGWTRHFDSLVITRFCFTLRRGLSSGKI